MKPKYVVKDSRQGKVLVARLKPDADLIPSIREIAEKESVKSGVILSGAGLLRRAHIRNCRSLPERYPITDANRLFTTIERPLEILAISGIVYTVKGKTNIHAHAVLSFIEDDKITVVGGHLLEGCIIFGFAEIVIMELKEITLEKTFDSETQTLQLFADENEP